MIYLRYHLQSTHWLKDLNISYYMTVALVNMFFMMLCKRTTTSQTTSQGHDEGSNVRGKIFHDCDFSKSWSHSAEIVVNSGLPVLILSLRNEVLRTIPQMNISIPC